jgi:hypothetical protein
MQTKRYLAVGDILINPDLLALATVEEGDDGPRLRLVLAGGSGTSPRTEVRLAGEEAGALLRWLRLSSLYLTSDGTFGPLGRPIEASGSRPFEDGDGSPTGRRGVLVGSSSGL